MTAPSTFVARVETTTGAMSISISDIDKDTIPSRFEALMGMLGQVVDPIVLTNDHIRLDEVRPGTVSADLNFKFVGSKRARFASETAFCESMNENLALKVFQCVTHIVKLPEGDLDVHFEVFMLMQDEARH
jgi:hypothetical protein